MPSTVNPAELKLAKQVVGMFEGELNLKDYKDEYTEGLRAIIDAKVAGEEIVAPDVPEPTNVIDLMEALRKSLSAVSADKKKPAKATLTEAGASKVSKAAPARRRRVG